MGPRLVWTRLPPGASLDPLHPHAGDEPHPSLAAEPQQPGMVLRGVDDAPVADEHAAVERVGAHDLPLALARDHLVALAPVAAILGELVFELSIGLRRVGGDEAAHRLQRAIDFGGGDHVLEMGIGFVSLLEDRLGALRADLGDKVDLLAHPGATGDEPRRPRARAAADFAGIDRRHLRAGPGELGGAGEPREAAAHHQHIGAIRRSGGLGLRRCLAPPEGSVGEILGQQLQGDARHALSH